MNEEDKKQIEEQIENFVRSQEACLGAILSLFIETNKANTKEEIIKGIRYLANHYKSKNPKEAEECEKELGLTILQEIFDALK